MKTTFTFIAALLTLAVPLHAVTITELIHGHDLTPVSSRLVYTVTSKGSSPQTLLLRADGKNCARLDFGSGSDYYTICANGKECWEREGDTMTVLSQNDVYRLERDLAFFPAYFGATDIYSEPVQGRDVEAFGIPCKTYECTSRGDSLKLVLWVDKSSGLLRRIIVTDANGTTETIFRNYKTIKGVRIATLVTMSSSDGSSTLRLRSADWGIALPATIFDRRSVREAALAVAPVSAKANRNVKKSEIIRLEDEIRQLKIEIAEGERRLQMMEKVYDKDRSDSAQLASLPVAPTHRRRYYGWGVVSYGSHANRERRKMIRNMQREAKSITSEYERVSKELVEKRVKLANAEAKLERIKSDGK